MEVYINPSTGEILTSFPTDEVLPIQSQNEMGYINISPNDNWTIEDTNLGSFSTIWFGNGVQYPPGNYTSGYYNDAWLGGLWIVAWHPRRSTRTTATTLGCRLIIPVPPAAWKPRSVR